MAGVGNSNLTLLDLASRMENNAVAKNVIELLAKNNEIMDDMIVKECNNGSSHITTVRTGIPEATWRLLNYGVSQVKSTTSQIKDSCGMLESYSTVDAKLVELAKDKAGLLLSEAKPILEGMSQQMATTLFYGNTALNPERFMGLAPRFAGITGSESADNVISGSGAGSDNTSIWLVVWGEDSVHGLFPQGSQGGVQQKNLGEQTVYDASNNPYQAERSHFKWDLGLTVRDWRQVVRIANIDVSELNKGITGSSADIIDLMVQAAEKVHSLGAGKAAFYANRTIRSYLRRQVMNRTTAMLSLDDIANGGKKVLNFDGIPVRRCDAILNTEAALT